jgi:predicted PurR-regulated permease PerM
MNPQKSFVALLIIVLSALVYRMMEPFIAYILGAAVLASLLYPIQTRLRNTLGHGPTALFLVLFSIVVAVIPLTVTTAAALDDAVDLSNDIRSSDEINVTEIELRIQQATGVRPDIQSRIDYYATSFSDIALGNISAYLDLLANLAVGFSLMIFLLYYFLKDGDKLVEWAESTAPLPEKAVKHLKSRIQTSTQALIKGHIVIAVLQALVAGIGLWFAGVPNYAFWTGTMLILSFIPLIGSMAVWLPASIYLFVVNRPGAGIFLFTYGLVIVQLTDNFLRPVIVDRASGLHSVAVIIGVLGGVILFGAAGIFIGPILMALVKALIEVYGEI